jgi:hypothetical protein
MAAVVQHYDYSIAQSQTLHQILHQALLLQSETAAAIRELVLLIPLPTLIIAAVAAVATPVFAAAAAAAAAAINQLLLSLKTALLIMS